MRPTDCARIDAHDRPGTFHADDTAVATPTQVRPNVQYIERSEPTASASELVDATACTGDTQRRSMTGKRGAESCRWEGDLHENILGRLEHLIIESVGPDRIVTSHGGYESHPENTSEVAATRTGDKRTRDREGVGGTPLGWPPPWRGRPLQL